MKSRWLRIARGAVVVLTLLLGVAFLAGYLLLGTEAGARFLLARIDAFVPGTLSIGRLEGPLRGPLVATNVVYETATSRVTIDRLALEWHAGRLARRRIDIQNLELDGVRVESLGPTDTSPFELPDLRLPLRLNLALHRARVSNVTLVSSQTTIDEIELITHTAGDRLEVERFTLRSPELRAEVAGWLEPQGDYPLDLEVTWDAGERGSGTGSLAGSLETLQVTHELTRPLRASIRGSLVRPLRDLTFDLALVAPPFDPRPFLSQFDVQLDPSLGSVVLGGEVDLRGSLAGFEIDGRVEGESELSGPLRFGASARRDGERWTVARATLEQTGIASPAIFRARGTFVVREDEDAAVKDVLADVEWVNLRWPLIGRETPIVRSPAGNARLEGAVDAYTVRAEANVTGSSWSSSQIPPTRIFLTGEGSRRGLRRLDANAVLLGGRVEARGSVEWEPTVRWQATVAGDGLDPALFDRRFPGSLTVRAESSGRIEDESVIASFAPLSLEGVLRDQPVTATGGVDIVGARIALHELKLAWGSASAAIDGAVAPELALDAEVRLPALALALPGATGSLDAKARLTGPPRTPRIVGEARVRDVVWDDLRAARLALDADVDLAATGQIVLHASGDDLGSETFAFDHATLEVVGSRDAHRLEFVARTKKGDAGSGVTVAAKGGLDSGWTWRGTLAELVATTPKAGRWSLASPTALRIAADSAGLERACLQGSGATGGRLCARGQWQANAGASGRSWSVAADLEQLPLSLADPFLAPGVTLTGAVDGTATLAARESGALVGEGRWSVGPGELTYPVATQAGARPDPAGGGKNTLRFARGEFSASSNERGVELRGELPLPDLGSVSASASLPEFAVYSKESLGSRGSQAVVGRLEADLTDLGFLQAFSPEISETGGRLKARIEVGGTLGAPRVSGEMVLSAGRARVPALGLQLTAIEFRAAPSSAAEADRETLKLTGSVRSGKGTLTLEGEAPIVASIGRPMRLAASGRHFQTMATREVQLTTAPDVELTFDGERVRLGGRVRIEEGEIEIRKRPPNVAKVSEDVVFVGERAPRADLPFDIDVRVTLGDKLEIAVLGLEGKPRGALRIVETEGKPTSATGEIRVDEGTFQAYGQDLEIESGRMVFAGPIDRPRVNLRASRKASDGTVAGLEVEGTLLEPRIALWSDPSMGSSDQLSYLLLGRPLAQATAGAGAGDADMVANAARSLGLKGGDLLARQLAARFGLEEARIETESVGGLEQASLVVGTYLSPRLYVSYGVGLFGAANTLRLRYELSRRYTLQATQGLETGADVLYTLERGRQRSRRRSDRQGDAESGAAPASEGEATEPRVVPPR